MLTLTENVKEWKKNKGNTLRTQYRVKNLQPQNYTRGTDKREKVHTRTTKLNERKNEGRNENIKHQRKQDYTTPTTWKEKQFFFSINQHVPQTPPHVFQINLVILFYGVTTAHRKSKQKRRDEKKLGKASPNNNKAQLGWTRPKKIRSTERTYRPVVLSVASVHTTSFSSSTSPHKHTHHPSAACQHLTLKTKNETFNISEPRVSGTGPFLSFFFDRSHDKFINRNKKRETAANASLFKRAVTWHFAPLHNLQKEQKRKKNWKLWQESHYTNGTHVHRKTVVEQWRDTFCGLTPVNWPTSKILVDS